MPIHDVPRRFPEFLGQVYTVAHDNGISLDGQNIFVYRCLPDGAVDVEFGVGARAPFPPTASVTCSETPAGIAAAATHWGDYARLGDAHDAVVTWCKAHDHELAGVCWEVYGHWSEEPSQQRIDVFYSLKP